MVKPTLALSFVVGPRGPSDGYSLQMSFLIMVSWWPHNHVMSVGYWTQISSRGPRVKTLCPRTSLWLCSHNRGDQREFSHKKWWWLRLPHKNVNTTTKILTPKRTPSNIPISCNRFIKYTLYIYDMCTITYVYIKESLTKHKPWNNVIKICNQGT